MRLVLVNIDTLFDSPLGRNEKWRERSSDRPTGVLGVSANAARFVVEVGMDLSTGDERWKIGMIETHGSPPSLTTLAAREGGYVEQIETQNIAWTPRNFYLLAFPERIVGFAVPSDRQLLAGWVKNYFIKPRTSPPGWADRAFYRANEGMPIVLAVNLEKAISARAAEEWLRDFQSETVKKSSTNFKLLASKLSDARSVLLQVDVKQAIEGTLRIEFDYSVEMLSPIAKELVLAVLEEYGADVEDFRRWGIVVKDNVITLSGRMSEATVRRFLSFAAAPRLTQAHESPAAPAAAPSEPTRSAPPPGPGGEPSPEVVLKATQQYFRAVSDIAHSAKAQKGSSQKSVKLWYDRSARQIEELPILYVDNEALDWGSKVARTIREMAFGINYTAKDTQHRILGTAGGAYGGYGSGVNRSVAAGVITKQNNAVLDVSIDGTWESLETSILDIRRKLVAKYKAEF